MVNRHEAIESLRPATVIDLDGTYVRCSTLKAYMLHGLRYLVSKGRLIKASRVATLLSLYALGRISHVEMKFKCLALIPRDEKMLRSFGAKMRAKINPAVVKLVTRNIADGHKILLATASPDFYIPYIWDGEFVATAADNNPGFTECRGNNKLAAVNKWLEQNGCRLDTVITDHHDDAPLIAANADGTNILVEPKKKTLNFFREFEPAHFLLIDELDK